MLAVASFTYLQRNSTSYNSLILPLFRATGGKDRVFENVPQMDPGEHY